MLNEYDMVIAKKDLSQTVKKGCRGVIVMIYNNSTGIPDYEVEFFDNEHNRLDLLTVENSDVEAMP